MAVLDIVASDVASYNPKAFASVQGSQIRQKGSHKGIAVWRVQEP